MLSRRSLLAGLFVAATALAPLQAYAASWVTLGSRTVNLFYDHDTIHVGLSSGLFSKIRLSVTGNAVFLRDLHVTFGNGSKVIVNRQAATGEIWVAARSGGFHCAHRDGSWVCNTTGETLPALLSRVCSEQEGRPLQLDF